MTCTHPKLKPQIYDQTLGVLCADCGLTACCWAEEHCSEALWNQACTNDEDGVPCSQGREDYCFLCEEKFP